MRSKTRILQVKNRLTNCKKEQRSVDEYLSKLSLYSVLAIKATKVASQDEKEEFINKIVLLSWFYHKNVVKLLGCCLESEMPLLVYEYIFIVTLLI